MKRIRLNALLILPGKMTNSSTALIHSFLVGLISPETGYLRKSLP
jgi:hypothetical protein